jgi:hypothetical protein
LRDLKAQTTQSRQTRTVPMSTQTNNLTPEARKIFNAIDLQQEGDIARFSTVGNDQAGRALTIAP